MNFIFKMAWRDSRASRRRLVLFSFSVVLGIAALVAIGSLGANLDRGIDDQAKGLLGADLIITGRTPIRAESREFVRGLSTETAQEMSFSSMMAFPSAKNLTRLVNVRAMEGKFPFYGDFTTVPADAPAKLRAGGDVVIVEETLLRQFDAKVGDQVKLGTTLFTIVGALQKLPGESSALAATMAPRALIPRSALGSAAELAGPHVHDALVALPAHPRRQGHLDVEAREVGVGLDEDHPTAGPRETPGSGKGGVQVAEMMQHEESRHRVERPVQLGRWVEQVALDR